MEGEKTKKRDKPVMAKLDNKTRINTRKLKHTKHFTFGFRLDAYM